MSQLISLYKVLKKSNVPTNQLRSLADLCIGQDIPLFINIEEESFVIQKLTTQDIQKIFSTKKDLKVDEQFFKLITEESIYTNKQRIDKLIRAKEDIFFNKTDQSKIEKSIIDLEDKLPKTPKPKEKNLLCAMDIARLLTAKYQNNKSLYHQNTKLLNATRITELAYLEENKDIRENIFNKYKIKEFKFDTFYRHLCNGINSKS